MAEIKDGILGGVHGKVGTVIGITWRGRHFLRSLPSRSRTPASEKQLIQRNKMRLVSPFTSKIKNLVNKYYPKKQEGNRVLNGHEQLNSHLLKEGIETIDGVPHLAIEKVLLSLGVLPPVVIKKINFLKDNRIKIQWEDTLKNVLIKPDDRLTIVIYNDSIDAFHIASHLATRQEKYAHLSLPEKWKNGNFHFWSIWESSDNSVHSTSLYHETIQLNPTSTNTSL
ncbi:DUF6266 family protein [Myroides pelagicus]|uniref:Uncharacterized protein n=1 Tax=Myroides pelagicus TaxID=270914 RepID=A0A7K1GPQ7_9FLAO|nr:DUF6266 family protein [Myroides pelagicus]MTH30847.1 hypothetical protein [Myroides pelagicus]